MSLFFLIFLCYNKFMQLSIIIVNHNAQKLLEDCLDSIYKNTPKLDFEIIVIDNNSCDKSLFAIKTNFKEVKLIENRANVGFAKAVNQGMGQAKGQFLLCLNNDTIVLPSSLNKLSHFMNSHSSVIAAGGKVLNPNGSIQFSCRRFPNYQTFLFNRHSLLTRIFKNNKFSKNYLMSDWPHNEACAVDWASACYLIMRREAIEKVGLMDERFFMYCEDVDWCLRAKKLGFKIYYVPDCPIIHLDKGYGKNFNRKIIEHHKSMYYFYKKNLRKTLFMDLPVLIFINIRAGFILLLNYLKLILCKIKDYPKEMF
ncbi:MAG: glycosyltransferase family 2 protein [Candidatus Omnitrophota bacterium]|nr:glycosyltransferase family 2 protein [Candidatus Omnitrophota bacterium]